MADQRRGRSPRRKSRPRVGPKTIPPSTRHTPGDRIEELAMIGEADLDLDDRPDFSEEDEYRDDDDRDAVGDRPDAHTRTGARGSDPEERKPREFRSEPRNDYGDSEGRGHERGQGRGQDRGQDRGPDRGLERGPREGGGRTYRGAEGTGGMGDEESRPAAPETARRLAPNRAPEEEFVVQVYYDRNSQHFVATCLEFPELKVQGHRRDDVVEEMSQKIGDELEMMRREGKQLPTPFSGRTYPEKLEVRLSTSLFRRLDMHSRQERVPIDQLVTELLTQALNRRPDGAGRSGHHQDRRPSQGQQKHHHGHGGGNRRGGGNQGGGGNNRNRNYHDTMGNRDNFMEYVRNLEKSGGFGKKR